MLSLIKGRLSNAGLQLCGELLLEPPELLVALLWRLFHSFLDILGESVDFVAQLFFGPEHQEGSRARLLFFRGDCYFEAPYPHLPIVDDVTLLGDPEPLETAQQNLSEFLQAFAVQAEVFISSDKGEINRNLINFRWHGVLQLNFQ